MQQRRIYRQPWTDSAQRGSCRAVISMPSRPRMRQSTSALYYHLALARRRLEEPFVAAWLAMACARLTSIDQPNRRDAYLSAMTAL